MREQKLRATEFAIPLDPLSVEVWLGDSDYDIGVAVFSHGVNDIAKAHFTWNDLYDALDYEEPVERLRAEAELATINTKKAVLKRMAAFVQSKGIKI